MRNESVPINVEALAIRLGGHSYPVTVVAFSPDSLFLASAAKNGEICIWDIDKRSVLRTIKRNGSQLNNMAFLDVSDLLLLADSNNALVGYNWRTDAVAPTPWITPEARAPFVLSDNKEWLLCRDNVRSCLLLNKHSRRIVTLNGAPESLYSMQFSQNGSLIALGGVCGLVPGNHVVKVYNTSMGQELASLDVSGSGPEVAFSGDGKRIVTAGGPAIDVWDTQSFERLKRVPLDLGGVRYVSQIGRSGISAVAGVQAFCKAGVLGLLSDEDEESVRVISCHHGEVTFFSVSPDVRWLCTCSRFDNEVLLWDLMKLLKVIDSIRVKGRDTRY